GGLLVVPPLFPGVLTRAHSTATGVPLTASASLSVPLRRRLPADRWSRVRRRSSRVHSPIAPPPGFHCSRLPAGSLDRVLVPIVAVFTCERAPFCAESDEVKGRSAGVWSARDGWVGMCGGNVIVKQVRPAFDSTLISPPWRRTTLLLMCRPRPVPTPGALVVKNGSNTCARVPGSMPGPL